MSAATRDSADARQNFSIRRKGRGWNKLRPCCSQSFCRMRRPCHDDRASVVVLCLSACLNILVGAVLLRHELTAAPAPLSSSNSPAVEIVQTQWVSEKLPGQVLYATNHFHWSEIDSTNYEEYVSGLRAIGCPEKTVRDIVLPEIEEYYERQRLMLSFSKGEFWLAGRQRLAADRKRKARFEQIKQEEQLLIQRLLGIEWIPNEEGLSKGDLLGQALSRFVFGPMPEDAFQSMVGVIGRYAEQTRELELRLSGISTDEDEAERRGLETKLREEMLRVLGRAQYDEFRARGMAIEMFDHTFAYADDLTPTEARRIALARSDAYDFSDLFGRQPLSQEERAERERAFTNAVAGVLGPGRFAGYQRSQDSNFREILDFTENNDLPKATAVQVYEMRRLAMEEVGRLRSDDSLDEAARQQQIDRIQSEIQQAAAAALGEKAYRQYLDGKGRWMTNVTGL